MRFDRDDSIDAFLYATVKIVPTPMMAKHPTRTYTAYLQAHPLVVKLCWLLRRLVWIAPWTEYQKPDDADPIYMKATNTVFMGTRHYMLMKLGVSQ